MDGGLSLCRRAASHLLQLPGIVNESAGPQCRTMHITIVSLSLFRSDDDSERGQKLMYQLGDINAMCK